MTGYVDLTQSTAVVGLVAIAICALIGALFVIWQFLRVALFLAKHILKSWGLWQVFVAAMAVLCQMKQERRRLLREGLSTGENEGVKNP